MRKRITFREETRGADKVFRAAQHNGPASPVRIFYIHRGVYVFGLQPIQWKLIWELLARTAAAVVLFSP